MKLILDIEDPDSLRDVVTQDLKEIGIKLPKHKKSKTKEDVLVNQNKFFNKIDLSSLCI